MGCLRLVSIPVKYLVYCISFLLLTSLSSLFRFLPSQKVQSLSLVNVCLAEFLAPISLFLHVVQSVR